MAGNKLLARLRIKSKKLTAFDYLLIALLLFGLIFFAYVLFRTPKYITVTVKVGEENIAFPREGVRDWFEQLFYKGMSEVDGLGNKQAEVLDIFSYDVKPNKKAVYLKLRVRGVYSKASNQYTYKGKPVLVGQPIRLNMGGVLVEGLITSMEGGLDPREKVTLRLEAKIWNESDTFLETSGVNPYLADAIKVGDEVHDHNGAVVLKVVDKRVEFAKKVVTNSSGQVIVASNPLLRDVYLVLEISAMKINDKYYVFDDIPVLIGEEIPLNLPYLSTELLVTGISPLR